MLLLYYFCGGITFISFLQLCPPLRFVLVGVKDTDKEAAGMLTWDPKSGDGGLPPLVQMSNGKWRVDFEALR